MHRNASAVVGPARDDSLRERIKRIYANSVPTKNQTQRSRHRIPTRETRIRSRHPDLVDDLFSLVGQWKASPCPDHHLLADPFGRVN